MTRYALQISILIVVTINPVPSAAQPLQRYMEERVRSTNFSGAVLIAQKGQVVLSSGYGMANHELQVPNSPEHIFRIGSLTKPFTATAILQLHQLGKLDISDPISEYVAPCPKGWTPVTVRHLLNHTSGIPDLFGDLEDAPVQKTREEIDRVLAAKDNLPLWSAPGKTYKYSNFNYMLLGYIIEVVAGRYWESFLIENMFTPLEMADTRYDDVWALVPGRATGYRNADGHLVNIEYGDHSAYSAGGLRSTISDLKKWHDAFIQGRLISREMLEITLKPYAGPYGFGWQVIELFGRSMYNHTGGIGGFTSHLAYYPKDQLLIIVLSNVENENAKGTACDLAAILFELEPHPIANSEWLALSNSVRCQQDD